MSLPSTLPPTEKTWKEIVLARNNKSAILAKLLSDNGVRHGQMIFVNLKNIRIKVSNRTNNKPKIYFRKQTQLEVVRRINAGDDKMLPCIASLPNGLFSNANLRSGSCDLIGLKIYSNNTIQIIQIENTELLMQPQTNYN
ncbi:MAG: hypothetical protein KGI58_02800 [Patescibacteria group bacterium]|nr:hypothetical protein [Patescibacteria group bacterium]